MKMGSLKKFAAAIGVLCAALYAPQASADSEGFYAELGGSIALPSEFDAKFGETASEWEPGNAHGAKLQLGWDFGQIRADVKARAYESSVDSISGTTGSVTRDDFWYGIVTFNLSYDFADYKVSEGLSLTPFVGAGIGAGGGYARATATQNGGSRRDNRDDYGVGGSLNLGVALNITESLALTTDYDFTYLDVGGGFINHGLNVGMRYTF